MKLDTAIKVIQDYISRKGDCIHLYRKKQWIKGFN